MKRNAWIILLLPGLPSLLHAGTTGEVPSVPPAYKNLRFDENYSCLADPAKQIDWFDLIKYISLRTNNPDVYLTLGGELRERFEGAHNPDFGLSGSHDAYWLQRGTFFGDLHIGDRLRFFAEGISGVIEGESQPAPPPQDDNIDLQFAFADFVPYLTDDERFTVRGGRFGMSLGSGRLLATRASPNIPFKFDGVELLYDRPGWQATAFLTRPAKEDPDRFDSTDDHTAFWGIYLTHWLDQPHKTGADLYYLGIERDHGRYASGSGTEHRHSFGARIFGEKNQFDWNAEAVIQAGKFGNESILAWTASLDTGYTWDVRWQPRLGLKIDIASGDTDPNDNHQGTFDALFFKSGYFNDASLLRPANLIDIHPNLGVNITRSISVNGGADVFWRYTKNDALYAPPGFVQIPASGTGSSYVGSALDANFQWQIQRHITLQASYVHFFTDSYIRQSGGGDVDYVSTTVSFVF